MPKPVPHLTLGKKQNQLFEGGRKVGKGQSSGHCPMMIQMTIRSPRCPRHADKCQPGVLHRLHPQHESSRLRTVGSEALVEMIQHNAARNTVPHSQSPWLQTDKANPSAWDKEANNSPPHPYPTPRRPLYRPAHLPRGLPSSHISLQTPASLRTVACQVSTSSFMPFPLFRPPCSSTLPHKLLVIHDPALMTAFLNSMEKITFHPLCTCLPVPC